MKKLIFTTVLSLGVLTTNVLGGELFTGLKTIKKETPKASHTEVMETLKSDNGLVIDIRGMKEWKGGHIIGAKRVDADNILKGMDYHIDNKMVSELNKVIVVCRSGTRATLVKLGLEKYFEQRGMNTEVKIYGLTNWTKTCNGIKVKTNPLDNRLNGKGITLVQSGDLWFSDKCERMVMTNEALQM